MRRVIHLRSPRIVREIDREKALIQEGRNQVLYILLAIGDENVAHDHWHPEKAECLLEARRRIVQALRAVDMGHPLYHWPTGGRPWPDFEAYTYCPG